MEQPEKKEDIDDFPVYANEENKKLNQIVNHLYRSKRKRRSSTTSTSRLKGAQSVSKSSMTIMPVSSRSSSTPKNKSG